MADSAALDRKTAQSEAVAAIKSRDPKYKSADIACIRAIMQAAVNVELFTIPLYMTSLYSVQGVHQINSKGSTLYEGRWWPGAAATPRLRGLADAAEQGKEVPLTANEEVFNLVFATFIEEMLHLQLASNMATRLGLAPSFTSSALQDSRYGWTCYDGTSMIPHILDFKDWKGTDPDLSSLTVKLRAMNKDQVELFLAIEETLERAESELDNPEVHYPDGTNGPKYFQPAPFNWFTASMTEDDLPLFGSIGQLYTCYWDYLEIVYTDGSELIDMIGAQHDLFNDGPAKEYPGIDGTLISSDQLKLELLNNIDGITGQGEGKTVRQTILDKWPGEAFAIIARASRRQVVGDVPPLYRASPEALKERYPGYDDKGRQTLISGDAQARIDAAALDHFQRFQKVKQHLDDPGYKTWDVWHQEQGENPWTADMLGRDGAPNLPSTADIATALNRLNSPGERDKTYATMTAAATGTLKGLTTALDRYWSDPLGQFPGPAMGGSGDRISICWAVTGKAPDLTQGVDGPQSDILYHACQGMALKSQSDPASCAPVTAYHSCKGSNGCKAQGGCGFVQGAGGGGMCGQSAATGIKSAPADNKCNTMGGCAVPISASQLYPTQSDDCYEMALFTFGDGPEFDFTEMKQKLDYRPSDPVYTVAWKAYCLAKGLVKDPHGPFPKEPAPSDIRLAMPPST